MIPEKKPSTQATTNLKTLLIQYAVNTMQILIASHSFHTSKGEFWILKIKNILKTKLFVFSKY